MERIIYNSKLKKILICFTIIVLLFGYVLPLKVDAGSVGGSLNSWVEDVTGKDNDTKAAWKEFTKDKYASERKKIIKLLKEKVLIGMSDDQIDNLITLNTTTGSLFNQTYHQYFSNAIRMSYDSDSLEIASIELVDHEWALPGILMAIGMVSQHTDFEIVSLEAWENVIDTILNGDDCNSITAGVENGQLVMRFKVKEITDVENAFYTLPPMGNANDWQQKCRDVSNNKYNHIGLFVEKINPDTLIDDEEEDTRTEKEIIIDLLVYKYDGLDSGEAETVYESGWYEVIARDEDGMPTEVELRNVPSETITAFGLSYESQQQVWEEQAAYLDSQSASDIGGVLLEPIFSLINFLADSLTSVLGRIMNRGQDGLANMLVTPVNASSLSKDDVHRVNTESFETETGILGTGIKHYVITYSPEEIFSGEIDLLSIDFISGKDADGNVITGDWASVRAVVSQWYKVLRMIAIIGLLSVLIYTGIKIIISSNAKDKAKYKEWIINWFIAVAILFSMHYIMSFIISVTGEVNQLLSSACGDIIVEKCESSTAMSSQTVNTSNLFVTNLMGLVRFMIQSDNFILKIGYEIMYIALLVYTIKFTFVYLKRVLNMAFLTLIAPIVALTYPIDKINDGRAQGFDMWLKEYIFNALLQPMHFIMYYVLVGSAVSIAASNPIYGIAVLAFMSEAEKLLKKIFGFDKASGGTVGGMAGAFAAGAIASNIKNIARLAGGKGSGGNGGSGAEKNELLDNPKPVQGLDVEGFTNTEGIEASEQNLPEGRGGASAADAHQSSHNPMADAERERLEEQWADGQLTEDELTEQQRRQLGLPVNSQDSNAQDNGNATAAMTSPVPETPPLQPATSTDQGTPIRKLAQSKFARGMANVGKTLLKPIWDKDHSAAYNGKRLLRKVGRAALGAGLGITAAAVQAGISITDGKYNPMEGIATFTAGYAGGGQIAKGFEKLGNAYTQGALEGDKKAIMERAQARWADREDVIAFNKANYKPEEIADITRIQSEHLLPYGFNLNEMKSVTKYAKQLEGRGLTEEQAYKQAANTYKLRQEITKNAPRAIYNKDEQKKYIETMLKGKTGEERTNLERAYRNGFASIVGYDRANQ